MENNTQNQLRVGLFLAAGLVAVLVTILLLGGDRALFKKHVTIYATMDNVQGLNKGSVVSVSGFTVGNIKEIKFSSERKALVLKMKIQEEFIGRITKGSSADIRTQGALGDKYVYIAPGEPNEKPLEDGDFLETAKSTDLMGIISEKGGEATKIFDIIDEIHRLTKIINADGRSEKIITNLVEASQNFKQTADETKKLVAELRGENPAKVREAVNHLNNVLAKIDKGEGTLGALINDPTLHERLKVIIGADSRKQSIQSLIRNSIDKSEK
jgi:phospholipid/cholesterol/gamma-HCH transport system substrate-binding protein